MFSFLVILGTVPGCTWSVRAYGHFEVGRFMDLLVTAGLSTSLSFQCSYLLPKTSLFMKHQLHTRPCTGP